MRTLREWRAERLLSQADLATRAGVRQATVADIERGAKLPRYRTIAAISAALEVAPADVAEFIDAIEVRAGRQRPRSRDASLVEEVRAQDES